MNILDKLLAHIAPYDCIVCGKEGQLLCVGCAPALGNNLPSRCFRCLALTEDFRVCATCRSAVSVDHLYAVYPYSSYVKEMIKAFKFEGKRAAASELAQYMLPLLPATSTALLVHIPTATDRIRERGYDHAKLLANALSAQSGLIHHSLLARTSQRRQVGASRAERLEYISGAFRVSGNVTGAHIILVDDVVTTGATLTEAAKVLRSAGAERVDAIVFAHTIL